MLINYYLITLELNKFEKENNLDKIEDQKSFLDLQQEKGLQVGLRPLKASNNLLEKMSNLICKKLDVAHVFVIYYDKKEGIYKIIESMKNDDGNNEIFLRDFRMEDLEGARIIKNDELSQSQTYENLKNALQNKYGKDQCNRGEYSIFGNEGGNCYDTVMEILHYYNKSDEIIKDNTAVKYREFFKLLKKTFSNSILPIKE